MAEELRLVTEDVSSSLWELVDKELAAGWKQVVQDTNKYHYDCYCSRDQLVLHCLVLDT